MTLAELTVGLGLVVVLGGALGALYLHSNYTFAEVSNYMDFEDQSRQALDRMSRTIRQANALTYCDPNKLTFQVGSNAVSFTYYPAQRKILRETSRESETLLTDCDYVRYAILQRNSTNGNYDSYPAATPDTCKVVQLEWGCSRPAFGRSNTAAAVSAKIVIRKQ